MQTILGAGGAIGTPLAKELTNLSHKVRLVARNPHPVNPTDELFSADLRNRDDVMQAVNGSRVVYLCVGLPYKAKVWEKDWPIIMQNTIDACIRFQTKLVFIDNVYMYSPNALANMTEDAPVAPCSRKGKTRAQLIEMLDAAMQSRAIDACIARSADFYGPEIKNSILLEMVYKPLARGSAAIWQRNLNKIHSFTYTPDAAKAIALLGNTSDSWGETWHLPTSKEKLTANDWINLFANELHTKPKRFILHNWMLVCGGILVPFLSEVQEMSYQYKDDYFFNSSKFEKHFAFKPTDSVTAVNEIVRLGITK